LAHLNDALADLERRGLRRVPAAPRDPGELSFCSNDYLGLAARPLAAEVTSGAGASRLISGERQEHADLERAFAAWLGVEACLAFTSGYAANVGALAALAAPGDLIVSDALNHASIIDGARLSRARVVVTPHNDVQAIARALEGRSEPRAWVAVESYYSMDADGPDLRDLRKVCDAFGAALFLDEAHAVGVLGPDGRGRAAEVGVMPDILVGTLGKAFGSQGAIVGGPAILREWLWNRARSFVFSTGLSPLAADAARRGLEEAQASPSLRQNVAHQATRLRDGLRALDLQAIGFGHIVPVMVGTSERAVALSRALREEGLVVPPIRPPTVPEGGARLRLTVTARHRDADIDMALDAFRRALASTR
jgi:8-amino-7-oxononanoate synthase